MDAVGAHQDVAARRFASLAEARIAKMSRDAAFILQEAGLSFLGLGVPFSTPTWGNILNVAQNLSVLQNNWWMWLPVGASISLFVLSVNFIGDGLRDASDPTQQG